MPCAKVWRIAKCGLSRRFGAALSASVFIMARNFSRCGCRRAARTNRSGDSTRINAHQRLRKVAVLARVIFPQMMRHALPGISNNWLVLLKATALISVIGLADDMMAVAGQAKNKTRDPFLFYLAVAGGYLFFTALSDVAFGKLRKIARRGL